MVFKAYTPCAQSFRRFFAVIVVFYKKAISPYLPMACRFYPTCSMYAREAILQYGVWKGLKLALWRLGRCHPFGGHGIDFVPLPDHCEQSSAPEIKGKGRRGKIALNRKDAAQ